MIYSVACTVLPYMDSVIIRQKKIETNFQYQSCYVTGLF